MIYNPGTKENAGIFSQSQGWLILAEPSLVMGNSGIYLFYGKCTVCTERSREIRKLEPYCYGQFTEGKTEARILVVPMYCNYSDHHRRIDFKSVCTAA